MESKINDSRILKNDETGFEIHFKPQKLGAYIALAIGFGLFVIDYILFRGAYSYGEFGFLLHSPALYVWLYCFETRNNLHCLSCGLYSKKQFYNKIRQRKFIKIFRTDTTIKRE